MTWNVFVWFAVPALVSAASGAVAALASGSGSGLDSGSGLRVRRGKICRRAAVVLTSAALALFASFIVGLWISLGRPPLRTMGETRLWYSFFALAAGLFTYLRWRYNWILSFSTVLASVFALLNILKPEIHDQTLMPALQSLWFIPHVTVYMFSYSLLGCAFLLAVAGLLRKEKCKDMLLSADTLVYIGAAFLTFGMLSGSLWAKEAWGHYWSWDPKETWALLTWMCYLIYIHLRLLGRGSAKVQCLLLVFAFVCLQMCWWGVNLLPSAGESVHVY